MGLILLCLALGWVLRAVGILSDRRTENSLSWVIYVALPANALLHIHGIEFTGSWLLAACMPWVSVGVAWLLFRWAAGVYHWSRETLGALILVAGWGNTSFVGVPMVIAYFGPEWISLVLVIDVLGSYLALSTLGIFLASHYSAKELTAADMVRRIVSFPPLIAVTFALVCNGFARPEWIDQVLQPIATTLTPVAMIAVGATLRWGAIRENIGLIAVGLVYRLALAPAIAVLIYTLMGNLNDDISAIAIFETAMPPMVAASVISIRYGLAPSLVAGLVGVGIPLSMLTLALWARLLG
jgi:predicted permease